MAGKWCCLTHINDDTVLEGFSPSLLTLREEDVEWAERMGIADLFQSHNEPCAVVRRNSSHVLPCPGDTTMNLDGSISSISKQKS